MEGIKRVFIDSNFFIALYNSADSQHAKAINLSKQIKDEDVVIVISNYIFLEVTTVISQKLGKHAAISIGKKLLARDNPITCLHIDPSLNHRAWEIFQEIENKDVSYVDCSIVAALEDRGAIYLLTFDEDHFKPLQKAYKFKFFKP